MARPRKTDPRERDWPRIREIPGRNGLATFQVDSLRDLTPRVRKNFKTRADADQYAEHLRQRRNNNGLAALGLSPAQMDDAKQAFEIIGQAGFASLCEAVRIAASHHRPVGGDLDLAQLRAKFIEAKERKGRRGRTLEELRNRTSVFAECFRREERDSDGRLVETYPQAKEITPAQVQAWFDNRGFTSANAQTAKNFRRVLNNLFAWGVKQQYLAANPIKGVDVPDGEAKDPEILSLSQCRALLETARTRFPELIGYLTLGLFCGLRPESELGRLTWEAVQWNRGLVHVNRKQSKVVMSRNVKISPNAMEWLLTAPNRKGAIKPPAFNHRWNQLRWLAGFRTQHRLTLAERAMIAPGGIFENRKLAEWPADGMRHTFATNHLAQHDNEALTSASLGHVELETLKFYSGLLPQTDPAEFWNLRPPAQADGAAGNVEKFPAAGAA